jgi:hypothetical protein
MYTLNPMYCKMKRQILTGALLLSVAAVLPTVSFASNISGGCDDGKSAKTIDDNNNWKTLCSVTLNLTGGTHSCIATGTAYVRNTVKDVHNEYRFNIARQKSPNTDLAGEILIDVNQNDNISDLLDQPVAVVQHFDSVKSGTRTFYWLGRKFSSDSDNIDAEHFSMGVVCTDGN